MTRPTRLTLLLAQILAGSLVAGCATLDDEACITVEQAEQCPTADEAADRLEGSSTCEDPVRKITKTGELVSETDMEGQDSGIYGPIDPYTECCYQASYKELQGQACAIGRPLRIEGEVSVAEAIEGCDWRSELRLGLEHLSVEERAELAAHWTSDALLEHASIAAFARMTLEMMSLGAPPELLARTAAAQADEIRHARDCFTLASAYAGQSVGPGPLAAPPMRAPDVVRLAVETFEEGCVGETLAVCRAAAQLAGATDPEVRRVLQGIIADETRHAELAWDTVAWALEVGGEDVRSALLVSAAALEVDGVALAGTAQTARHGLPGSLTVEVAVRAALVEVIEPSVVELLAA